MGSLIHPDDAWTIWAIMLGCVGLSIYLEQTRMWAAKITGPVLALLVAAALSNAKVLPLESPSYGLVWDYIVPLSIPLLLFRASLFKIVKSTGSMYDGTLWIDEAHPLGILGHRGRGTYDHFNLSGERLHFGGTLSKAFGGFGGIIPGSADFIARVRGGPVMIGASPPPSPVAAATLAGIERVAANPQWRNRLWANARRLREGIRGLGFEVESTHVPIAAFALGSAERMQQVHRELLERGIAIQYTHYSGAGADGVLRMVVFSTHTPEQIARLIEELGCLV